jgi:hypothetical protein
MNREQVESRVASLLNEGADSEAVLRFMRENRLSQLDSVQVLSKLGNLDFGEVQMIVFRSKTWADRLEVNLQLQDDLLEALLQQQEENDDPSFKIEVEQEKPDWPKLSTNLEQSGTT